MSEFTPKRKRDEEQWKDNLAKVKRAKGEAYTNRKNQPKCERKTGKTCRCKRRCLTSFTTNLSTRILENFNSLSEQNAQDAYLQNLIKVKPVVRSKSGSRPCLQNYIYEIHIGEVVKRVCREGFASLHGIGTKRVRRVANLKAQGKLPKDLRGRHHNRANKKSEELVDLVKYHIESFPYDLCHYGQTGKKKRYLSSQLNVLKMYILFLKLHFPEVYATISRPSDAKTVKAEVTYKYYLNYYQEHYNYPFGRPRTDVCSTCEGLKAKIANKEISNTVQKQYETQLKCHEIKADLFYTKLRSDLEYCKTNSETDVICFDFKQNIPCPHMAIGEVFYSRQLWLHVMSVYSGKSGRSVMYCWPENIAKKGANEVASVLDHYISVFLKKSFKNLLIYTDSCRGQNLNHTMVRFWQSLVQNGKFEKITYSLPERGHSYLPCDRHFAMIEKMQRRIEKVETPEDWINKISEMFKTIEVTGDMIKDFTTQLESYFIPTQQIKALNDRRVKYTITKYKKFVFQKDNPLNVFDTLNDWNNWKFSIVKDQAMNISFPTQGMYSEQLPIKPGKLQDVKKLAQYVSKAKAINFYNNLYA